MAGATTTTLANVLQQTISNTLIDAATRYMPFVQRLSSLGNIRRIVGGKEAMRQAVNYAGNSSVGSYAEGDSIPSAGYQATMQAHDDWRYNWVTFKVTGQALAKSRGGAQAGSPDAWEFELQRGLRDLLAQLNTQLTGNNSATTDINGLQHIISASNTVHGIDQSTYSWWRAQTKAAGGAAISADMLQQVIDSCRDKADATMPGFAPTAIYASRTQIRKMAALGIAKMTLPNPSGRQVGLTVGTQNLEFDGLPIVPIAGLTNTIVLVVSEPTFSWRILEQGAYPSVLNHDDLPTGEGFLVGVEPVETGEDATSMVAKVYSQLICEFPPVNGIISGLSTT